MNRTPRSLSPGAKLLASLAIAKVPLCLLVAGSALFGYVFAAAMVGIQALAVTLGVFLLACGGASLNSFQERRWDGLMVRTRRRPMVRGTLSPFHAVVQALVLITAGLGGLLISAGISSCLAGAAGIVLYNLVYTNLKSFTLWAIIPGAVCGAVPPYIGWLAAGGIPFSFGAALVTTLLFLWQIPHFLLVLLLYRNDYDHGVAPNLLDRLSVEAVHRIFLPWLAALATTMITFTLLPILTGLGKSLIIANAAILVTIFFYQLLGKRCNYRLLFHLMNLALFLFMLSVAVARFAKGCS